MTITLHEAVVHYVKKDAHKAVSQIDVAAKPLGASPQLDALVESILATYNNKHAKQAGVFQKDVLAYPFSVELSNFVSGGQTLLEASERVLTRLTSLMDLSSASTGGHIFFAHYTRDKSDYVIVVKLLTAPGQIFSKLSTVQDATHLSVDKLQVAARINLTAWKNGSAERYVTFVSTREGGHTSNYFREFIGCDVTAESRVESKKLAAVVDEFIQAKLSASQITEEDAVQCKQRVFDHAVLSAKNQEPVSLSDVASLVWPADQTAFLTFLSAHSDPPTDFFSADKRSLRSLSEYSYRSKEFKLSMSLQFKLKHNVTIDHNRLVIENPPVELIDELSN